MQAQEKKNEEGKKAGKGRTKAWTEAEAREVLAEQARSGLGMDAYAKREGLTPSRLFQWRRRLADQDASAAEGTGCEDRVDESKINDVTIGGLRMVAAAVVGGNDGGPAITVRLRGKVEIEVRDPERVDPGWVAKLTRDLEEVET